MTHKIGAADYNIFYLEFLIESTFQLTHSCTMRNMNEVLLSAKPFLSIFFFFGYPLLGRPKLDFFILQQIRREGNPGYASLVVLVYALLSVMLDIRTNNQISNKK